MQEQYYFKQIGREVILQSDSNTLINYCRNGKLRLLPTLRNRLVYRTAAFKLNVIRHTQPVTRLANFSVF